MVPISALTALPQTMTLGEAAAIVGAKKYMRVPVYADTGTISSAFCITSTCWKSSGSATRGNGRGRSDGGRLHAHRRLLRSETKKAGPLLMDMHRRHETWPSLWMSTRRRRHRHPGRHRGGNHGQYGRRVQYGRKALPACGAGPLPGERPDENRRSQSNPVDKPARGQL